VSDGLSVENLLSLDASPVPDLVYNTFLQQLQASPSVHSTFFGSTPAAPVAPNDPGWTDSIATALVCSSMARSSMYGFSGTVNGGAADAYWTNALNSPGGLQVGAALYDWAFPSHCTGGGHSFQDYLLNQPQGWAQQLADRVVSAPYIDTMINKLIPGDPNWLVKLNVTFYKLHRLDPQQQQRAVAAWKSAYPAAIEQWPTYNYLAVSRFQANQFLGQVNTAIGVGKDDQYCTVTSGGLPICTYWTDYGLAVVDFLGGTPKRLGFRTGRDPDNHPSRRPGGCFLPGSPVHLESGETLPIHEVEQGDRLLAHNGHVGEHTGEIVALELHEEIPVYGINELEPFFSAGHLFWTNDGWKALEPEIALAENPQRSVGKLDVGDVVHRIRAVAPLSYDEVPIERITGRLLGPGERLHGMHLLGAGSYHVHGFLVAMNYPQITEQRLTDGFAKLSPEERRHLADALEPVMVLLRKAIGDFIEQPIRRSLAQ
jgi:hypothetical protein